MHSQIENIDNFIQPPIIHVTTDYDQFKLLSYNRPINHVEKISISLERSNKLYVHPIIVNKKMEIVDGQNRYEYAKKMQIPLYYVIDEFFEPIDLIHHNTASTNWSLSNYAKFYSIYCGDDVQVKRNYEICVNACERFKISFSSFIKMFHHGGRSASAFFREGRLNLTKSKNEIYEDLLRIETVLHVFYKNRISEKNNRFQDYFLVAIHRLTTHEEYSEERMIIKMDQNLDLLIQILKFKCTGEILKRFLEIYNKNSKNKIDIQIMRS